MQTKEHSHLVIFYTRPAPRAPHRPPSAPAAQGAPRVWKYANTQWALYPMGVVFYWGRGITRVGFNRPLYPAHVDASD